MSNQNKPTMPANLVIYGVFVIFCALLSMVLFPTISILLIQAYGSFIPGFTLFKNIPTLTLLLFTWIVTILNMCLYSSLLQPLADNFKSKVNAWKKENNVSDD